MITFAKPSTVPSFEELLTKMMPHFRYFAEREMMLKADNYDECIQDLTCLAYGFYMSLVERGLTDRLFYTPIMKYSIGRFREGRHFNGSSATDVLGDVCRLRKRAEVKPLEPYDHTKHTWAECFETDGRINVAREVAFKLDCEAWMNTFDWKRREILEGMLQGDTTNELAQRFKLSAGRISQHRREFFESWQEFRNTDDNKHRDDDLVEELARMAEEEGKATADRVVA